MAWTVHVVRHDNANTDADSVSGSYAKEVKDKLASTDKAKVQIASAWDPDTGGIVTTICLSD